MFNICVKVFDSSYFADNTLDLVYICMMIIVCLSLLTMISLNQMCEVLLFVCSKIADETSPSSKLPVADRTRK